MEDDDLQPNLYETNIYSYGKWAIEIDGLPIKNGNCL